jgi:hypothetical protein
MRLLLMIRCTLTLLQACDHKSAGSPEYVRGSVRSLDGHVLTMGTANGSVRVQPEEPTRIGTVVPSNREHITGGSFLGITSVSQPDGSERASGLRGLLRHSRRAGCQGRLGHLSCDGHGL